MDSNKKKIIVTGGGTGGHVFPALAIATELKSRGFEVLYVGSERGFEARLVPQRGFPIYFVRSGAVKNQGLNSLGRTFGNLAAGILWSINFLLRERPKAVVGVGGYVSVPVCAAAALLRIPVFLQEQNVSVGIANRVLGKFARKVFLGFPQAASSFSKTKTLATGNPIRADFVSASFPTYDSKANRILIMGGSQGAHALNEAIVQLLEKIEHTYPGISILHQTGEKDFLPTLEAYKARFKGPYEVVPFIEDMVGAYASASLVICRSGALTVSELIQVGRPAIFVPYPRMGQNDQTANAYYIEKEGAARVVEQGDKFPERLWNTLSELYSPQTLEQMSRHYSRLRWANATATIADEIGGEIGG